MVVGLFEVAVCGSEVGVRILTLATPTTSLRGLTMVAVNPGELLIVESEGDG